MDGWMTREIITKLWIMPSLLLLNKHNRRFCPVHAEIHIFYALQCIGEPQLSGRLKSAFIMQIILFCEDS